MNAYNGSKAIGLVLAAAKKQGLTKVDLAARMGVTKQRFNNWCARGLPMEFAAAAARVVEIDPALLIDVPSVREQGPLVYAPHDSASAFLAAEITKLDKPLREIVTTVVEMLVAYQKRDGRKKPAAREKPGAQPDA